MFSPQTRHYFENAQGYGQLAAPTHQSEVGSREHGHFFHLQLQLDAHRMVRALAYYCPRCVPAIACGAYLHERLVGQPADSPLTMEQLLRDLGGLPPQRSFYAWMAIEAVRQALHPANFQ